MSRTYPCQQCNIDDGSPICLQDERCPGRATAVARDALKLSEHMNDQNNALRLCVSDLAAVILRMAAGIDHLSELARQWEPDHSSGADRRGWVLAKDARDDALRLLQEDRLDERSPRFRPGTKFRGRHKDPATRTVVDIHTTRNLKGELVRIGYVTEHLFCGQIVVSHDVCESTIARSLLNEGA